MKRSVSVATAAAVAALLTAGPAAAKGVEAATVCGADRCVDVRDQMLLFPLAEGRPPTDPPQEGAPWFRTTLTMRDETGAPVRSTISVAPSARLIRGEDGSWMPMGRLAVRALAQITRGLEPLPASTLPGTAPDPQPAPASRPDAASSGGDATPLWQPILAGALLALALAALARRRLARAG